MILIIPRVPEETTISDVRNFISEYLTYGFFFFKKRTSIDKIQIKILRDNNTSLIEYHALIYIKDEKIAKKIIRKLDKKSFLGKLVNVREYHIRSFRNDKRANHLEKNDLFGNRKGDRRRGKMLEEITNVAIVTFEGRQNFNRKFV